MCFTYRIAESMDSRFNLLMLSLALEEATSKAEVNFPSVYCLESTPPETTGTTTDDSESDASDDEFYDALTDQDPESPTMEDWEEVNCTEEDWTPIDCTEGESVQANWDQADRTDEERTEDTPDEPDHPLAGWHSQRLIESDWTQTNFIDKTDHIDFWSRHTEYTLSKCTWCTLSVDAWPKPKNKSPRGAPDLMLITPEGDVCWLDDPFDYDA